MSEIDNVYFHPFVIDFLKKKKTYDVCIYEEKQTKRINISLVSPGLPWKEWLQGKHKIINYKNHPTLIDMLISPDTTTRLMVITILKSLIENGSYRPSNATTA